MNKRQKEVQQEYLDREKAVLKKLEANYKDALDEINSKIELLMARQDADMQHVIYQVQYQKALKTQVQAILEQLQTNEFETVSEYIAYAYEDGYLGTMYDMQGQGIPLIFPIDQQAVVDAIQSDTKLSEDLYTAMGKDITDLKKKIIGEISRGLASGQMYAEITRNIASWAQIPKNNAARIARTEAHRIQCKAAMDAQKKAKSKGADIVKQWDAALDARTRDSHRDVDGEVREIGEKFSNGLMYPGDPHGKAGEVINCRCALLQRARWALGNNYTKWTPDAPVTYSDDGTVQLAIIEAKDYSDFQKKYKQASERVREGAQKMNEAKTPVLSHDIAEIDYRAEKVTFKDLQEWKKSIGNVTDDEYSIIDGMSETGYIKSSNSYKINKAMREGKIQELSEGNQKTIETLKKVIDRNVSDVDAVLIRKVDRAYLESVYNIKTTDLKDIVDELNAKKIGETYIEKGFVSTSYKKDKNIFKNDEFELDIYAPRGTNMFLTKNRTESEIILQANTRFELEGAILTDEGKVRLLMKVVPDDVVEEALENFGKSSTMKVIKRGQLDTGYSGKIPDDKLSEYNKKAFEQIKLDTGYTDEKATDFHNALLEYFGGDYEAILSGETETAKIIKNGIKDMPIYDGAIYRGMVFDNDAVKMFTNLKPGDEIPQKGIIESWSSNERAAISFCGANDYYRSSVILECADNDTGVGVQHISKFGDREAEVLTSTKYEVVEVTIENKYDYLSNHKELLYSPDDLDWVEDDVKENIVCRIKVKEKP